MKFQLFGSRNVRTSVELKAVGQRKKITKKKDDWGIDAVSAMRVPILSSKASSPRLNQPTVANHLKLVSLPASLRKKVGVYSSSSAYCHEVCTQLGVDDLDVFSFSNDKSSIGFKLEEANKMDAWLIHMDDADESPWLECVLDLGASASSLFLFEQNLTKQCLNKIQTFMLETKQAC